MVKFILANEGSLYSSEQVEDQFCLIECVLGLVCRLTPREFINIFPITKNYDGERWEMKDYFYSMKSIREFGIDRLIGKDAMEFLFDYWNEDISMLMVHVMSITNRMYILNGGEDITFKFLKDNGVHPVQFYEDNGMMINCETGERHKISKSKITAERKHLNVLDGGSPHG